MDKRRDREEQWNPCNLSFQSTDLLEPFRPSPSAVGTLKPSDLLAGQILSCQKEQLWNLWKWEIFPLREFGISLFSWCISISVKGDGDEVMVTRSEIKPVRASL